MKIHVPVIDMPDIILEISPDNPECIRMTVTEADTSFPDVAHTDLLPEDIENMIDALNLIRTRTRSRPSYS